MVTLLKFARSKEVINRLELSAVAEMIRRNPDEQRVRDLRFQYRFMKPERLDDGQIAVDCRHVLDMPRLLFAAEYQHLKGQRKMLAYNGLVVIEVNGLKTYEEAVAIRNQAAKMEETVMAFLGASGKSVKIVCRGELFKKVDTEDVLPTEEDAIRQFHLNLYETARRAYQNQFGFDIEYLYPLLERTVYLSADPDMYFNPNARAFKADAEKHDTSEPVTISEESDHLMPGRTLTRSYQLNWLFIVKQVLGDYYELPDEERQMQLLMRIARMSLEQGIPLSHAQGLTLLHPALNTDPVLVRNVFSSVYEVILQEEYCKKHKIKPLKSIPDDMIQAMRTEIFLESHFDMRKNLMTGVAEYRSKFSEDQTYKPLTEEVRNDMTLQAIELGIKGWDQNVNRYVNSTRIEQYDPINTWLDSLPRWDGKDRIKELAARVPTHQPHWEKYLKMWPTGMVAQWRESNKQLTGNALIPLLIGRQGCGKSRFCKILLPQELRMYYNDQLNFKNEFDLNIALTSFALINIDEFDKTTNSQQIVLKYLLSSADVKFRPPFGKTIQQFRRYTSFIGTTNQQQPLVDPTGSRRFVCVGIPDGQTIDYTDNLNHRQLFAQALHLFNNNERYWLDNEEIETLIAENEPYQQPVDLEQMIAETFDESSDDKGRWWRSKEILDLFLKRYPYFDSKKASPIILGKAMNSYKFKFKKRIYNGMAEYWLKEK